VLVDELPPDARSYQPDHAAIEARLPAAPASPYPDDQFYDLLVSASNAEGESKKTLVGSFCLTPEFRCPSLARDSLA